MASGIRRGLDAAGPGFGRERGEEGSPGTGRIVGPAGVLWKTRAGPVGAGASVGQLILHLTYPWYVTYRWSVIRETEWPMEQTAQRR